MLKKHKLTTEEIRHLAKLANLEIKDEVAKLITGQFGSVLDFVAKLGRLNTSQVKPTPQVTGLKNVFREDVVEKARMLTQEEALSNAKRIYKGYFVAKAVFGE